MSTLQGQPASQVRRSDRWWVLLLCLAAMVRTFVFSAAFPFFNNVDEMQHFDLVLRYSHGEMPRRLSPFLAESAQFIAAYDSPEYLRERLPAGERYAVLWTYPRDLAEEPMQGNARNIASWTNHEDSGAPLYYGLAGIWLNLGRLLGLTGGFLLYWIRFLNVPLVGALVWTAFVAARMVFPGNRFLTLGVPALLAFFPQSIFYAIQSDVPSPLCFGVTFVALLRWLRAEPPGMVHALALGLATAATGLTKIANLPAVALVFAVVLVDACRRMRTGATGRPLRAALTFLLCAGLPLLAWGLWCRIHFGDWTGAGPKIQHLGWTPKPFAEWWDHPLFTLSGLGHFLRKLTVTFWRGELVWHLQPLANATADRFYLATTALFLACGCAGLLPRLGPADASQRRALGLALASVLAGVAFLAVLSLAYDFGSCWYPSKAEPFFTSGRLLAVALVPFALLYLWGFDRALGWTGARPAAPFLLGALLGFLVLTEIGINHVVFASPFNWFALWSGALWSL